MEVADLCAQIGGRLQQRSAMLAIAESCTGGWIAKCITDVAGSSQWFDRGFVTYSNAAKIELVSVNPESLEKFGAVSEQVALEMATGAVNNSQANFSVAVTGIAGPDGGSDLKPVGTVCFAWTEKGGETKVETVHFSGERDGIRSQTVCYALDKLLSLI